MVKCSDVHGINYDMHQHFNNMFYLDITHCKQPDTSVIYEFSRKKHARGFFGNALKV